MKSGVVILAALPLLAGCHDGKSGDAVAFVNDKPVTAEEFQDALRRVREIPGQDFSGLARRKELLDEIIIERLLFEAAMKEDLVMRSERLRREVAREYLNDSLGTRTLEATEREIADYYAANRNELERVRASHILIKPEDAKDDASWDRAGKKAERVLAEIRAGGENADFAAFAREHSEDAANRDEGGDLGYFNRGRMVPEFSAAAFALGKVGDMSGAVRTSFGFHIIQLTGSERGIGELRGKIRSHIEGRKLKKEAGALFETLRNRASIRIVEDRLAGLETGERAEPGGPPGES